MKKAKPVIVFITSLIIAYLVVGYINSTMFVAICWVPDVTIWQKLREYYVRTFSINIGPAFVIAIITTALTAIARKRREIIK